MCQVNTLRGTLSSITALGMLVVVDDDGNHHTINAGEFPKMVLVDDRSPVERCGKTWEIMTTDSVISFEFDEIAKRMVLHGARLRPLELEGLAKHLGGS